MANTKSAKKNVRKNKTRRQINLNRKSEVKTAVKRVMTALANGEDVQHIKDLMREAESEISRAKNKIFHANNSARKVSRLAKRISKYEQEKSAAAK